jgi:hypothetical protein
MTETSAIAERIIIKPLLSWDVVQKYNGSISNMLQLWNGAKETPETFDSLYVCLNLSKIDAIMIHGAQFHARMHWWIDGGFRWDSSALMTMGGNDKSLEDKVYFSESKPFELMGGVFGGSIHSLQDFSDEVKDQIPREIRNRKPFTDQTVYRAIAKRSPSKFLRVPLYSKALVGNYLFGSAFLEQMLPAVVNAGDWEKQRPLLAKSEMILLLVFTIFIALALRHKRS